MSILSLFRRKAIEAVSPPPPMPIVPGCKYTMVVGNPFEPDPVVQVDDVRAGWVRYRFLFDDGPSRPNHTTEGYFRNCYKRCDDIPQL